MRKSYLDNIRWLVQPVVVLYHVFYMYNAQGVLGGLGRITASGAQRWDLFLYAVYPWMMPILFMVSGICARSALERKSAREFLRSRTVRLLVPSTVGLFVFYFIQGYVSMALNGALEQMQAAPAPVKYVVMALSGIGTMWYIQLLWVFSALLVPLRGLEKDRLWNACRGANIAVLAALAVPFWLAAQVLNAPVIIVYRFGFYGAAFLLGYFAFSHDEVIAALKKWFAPLLAVALALGVAFCARYFGENYADAPVYRTPLFAGYGWFACLAILGGAAKYGDRETRFTRWLGSWSWGMYLFHYLCISAVALTLGRPGRLPAAAVYLISAAAGFAGSWLLYAVISRIPVLRWCVLGIGKEKRRVQG